MTERDVSKWGQYMLNEMTVRRIERLVREGRYGMANALIVQLRPETMRWSQVLRLVKAGWLIDWRQFLGRVETVLIRITR